MLGALVEPLGTVVYGHDLVSKITQQNSIAIVGAGAIGILHALYAHASEYTKVFLINASEPHLAWCIERGIVSRKESFVDSEDLPAKILAATNNIGVDAVYLCTSRPTALAALRRALTYVRNNGCIDLVGGIKDGDIITELIEIEDLNSIRRANFCGIPASGRITKSRVVGGKNVYITGQRGTSLEHLQYAIEGLRRHGDTYGKVLSHIVPFDAVPDLFNKIAKGPIRDYNGTLYIKAVIDMQLAGKIIQNV